MRFVIERIPRTNEREDAGDKQREEENRDNERERNKLMLATPARFSHSKAVAHVFRFHCNTRCFAFVFHVHFAKHTD